VLSHVPGGVGVFEAILLAAFSDKLGAAPLAAALLLYRLIYVVLPMLVACHPAADQRRAAPIPDTPVHARRLRSGRADSGGTGVPLGRGAAVFRRDSRKSILAWNTSVF
jgi:hypothetical protein